MAIDTPARIAILGAGPIGLEAGLYARFLGYDVDLYERGRVAENLLRWGHVRLFSPFGMNRSSLGLSALSAQETGWQPPPDEAILTGRELAENYYLPLANSDLLMGSINEQTQVLAVGREGLLKGEQLADDVRADAPFRILLGEKDERGAIHSERVVTADVVIDATGTYGNHRWLGEGGIPAIGEQAAQRHIEYGLPDILGSDRERYARRHTLVIGSGYSAASSVVALDTLGREAPYTSVTWITRRGPESGQGPICRLPEDRLPERDRLAKAANRLATEAHDHVTYWPETTVEAIEYHNDPCCFSVSLAGQHAGQIEVNEIIANVGYRPDTSIFRELHVHECYATEGPMRLATALIKERSGDCLDLQVHGAESLINPEPDFYILGAKSYGRNSHFLISTGLRQIQELFTLIGDRPDLDLYAGLGKLHA